MSKTVRRPRLPTPATASAGHRAPDVILDIVFDDGIFFIAIENIGERPAVDVSVKFDTPFRGAGGERVISALPLFRGIPFLAPRRRITTLLDASAAYFQRREPTKISATISYSSMAGERHEVVIRHDLEIYRDLAYVPGRAASSDLR